ncbi:hypothetical protein GGQ84_001045 [Desulfitispora alkaliphila]|uniref:hypothetical protein n=1 Tax=Desulfitispora alkaliphila TaxID=622674 RepID=UPI003D1B5B1E
MLLRRHKKTKQVVKPVKKVEKPKLEPIIEDIQIEKPTEQVEVKVEPELETDLMAKTKSQLILMAKKQKVKVTDKMTKAEIIKALN